MDIVTVSKKKENIHVSLSKRYKMLVSRDPYKILLPSERQDPAPSPSLFHHFSGYGCDLGTHSNVCF